VCAYGFVCFAQLLARQRAHHRLKLSQHTHLLVSTR
jgi:hypothetical protein